MVRAIQKEYFVKYRVEIIVFTIFLVYLLILRIFIPISNGRLLPGLSYIPLGEGFADWDYFVMMSRDIFSIFKGKIVEPFCYRPFIPLIAGLLPFNIEISYSLITFLSIYLTGIMLYFTLRLKFNKMLSLFGLVMFCLLCYLPSNWIITDYSFFHVELFMIYLVDVESWLIIICCFYCILSSKKIGFAISLTLGVLIKEVVLFTIPVFLIYELLENDRNEGKRQKFYSFLRNIQYIVPGILTFLILHFIVIPQPTSEVPAWYLYYEKNDYGSIGMILAFIGKRIDQIINDPLKLFQWTIGIWGIPLVLLWFFNKKSDFVYWLKLYGIFIILVYLQLFWGMAEGKYIDLAFFPMISLGVSGLNRTSILINNKIKDVYGSSDTKRICN
ncbi:MAG: hypothetical protein ACFFBC_02095 [Promethearchaeota archaeon]